jgi:hypothetical protein
VFGFSEVCAEVRAGVEAEGAEGQRWTKVDARCLVGYSDGIRFYEE